MSWPQILTFIPWAVLSAVFSAFVGWRSAKKALIRSEWSSRVDDILEDMTTLSETTLEYWSKALEPLELGMSAALIRTKYWDISSQLADLIHEAKKKEFDQLYVKDLMEEVFEETTGADFDSPSRKVDVERAVRAVTKIDELRRAVRNCRLRCL